MVQKFSPRWTTCGTGSTRSTGSGPRGSSLSTGARRGRTGAPDPHRRPSSRPRSGARPTNPARDPGAASAAGSATGGGGAKLGTSRRTGRRGSRHSRRRRRRGFARRARARRRYGGSLGGGRGSRGAPGRRPAARWASSARRRAGAARSGPAGAAGSGGSAGAASAGGGGAAASAVSLGGRGGCSTPPGRMGASDEAGPAGAAGSAGNPDGTGVAALGAGAGRSGGSGWASALGTTGAGGVGAAESPGRGGPFRRIGRRQDETVRASSGRGPGRGSAFAGSAARSWGRGRSRSAGVFASACAMVMTGGAGFPFRPLLAIRAVTRIRNESSAAMPKRVSRFHPNARPAAPGQVDAGGGPRRRFLGRRVAGRRSAGQRSGAPPLGRRSVGFGGPTRSGHRSATLNFALRARGLTATSSADATTGLRVKTVSRGSSRKATFTRRSSSEWKLMMAARPPGLSRSGNSARIASRCSISSLTAIRSAWKTRVAGSIGPHLAGDAPADEVRQAAGGRDRLDPAGLDDPPRHAAAVPLLAILEEQTGQFLLAERVDQVGRGRTALRVVAHVERAVGREAEPPGRPGELVRREAQVEQDPVRPADPEVLEDRAEVAVRGVDQGDRKAVRGPLGQGEHLGISVQPDDPPPRTDPARQRRRVPPRADRPVDDHRAVPGREPGDDLVQEDGPVDRIRGRGFEGHGRLVDRRRARCDRPERTRSIGDSNRVGNPVKPGPRGPARGHPGRGCDETDRAIPFIGIAGATA